MIGDAPRSLITGVPGWESADEQHWLFEYASQVPDGGVIVEIGAEYGMSASLFCKAAKSSVLIYSIDLFPGDMLEKHRSNLKEAGLADRSKQLKGSSQQSLSVQKMGDTPIDLLFIDGDHSYSGVVKDIELWTPLVRPGGVVAFHDCACATNRNPHLMHFEVTKAVSEWFTANGKDWQLEQMADSLMVFRRSL